MKDIEPLVSICCITYNHENYIRDAIEGFLMQKTSFPIEIIIHDDASTDNTAQIIKEYEDKYPDLFCNIFQNENQWSKGGGSIYARFVYPQVRGKYIALCEGDDYWTDPLKLQKQVDFLEQNLEYGLVHADCHFYYEDKQKWKYKANKNLANSIKIDSKEELFYQLVDADYKIRTATVLFRKDLLMMVTDDNKTFLMGDTPIWLDFSQLTKFKYFDEVFAVYRILSNSASRSNNKQKQYRFGLSMAEMRIYYCNKYNYPINNKLKNRYNKALITYLLFDYQFHPLYPFFEPYAFQQFQFKYARHFVFNIFIKTTMLISKFANQLVNKLRDL